MAGKLDILRRVAEKLRKCKDVVVTVDVNNAALLGLTASSFVVSSEVAGTRIPIRRMSTLVQSFALISGPREDGTTSNVGTIFVGDSQVTLATGLPLIPGETVGFDGADLANIWVVFTNVDDRLRVLYFA